MSLRLANKVVNDQVMGIGGLEIPGTLQGVGSIRRAHSCVAACRVSSGVRPRAFHPTILGCFRRTFPR
jgi:hypothetical protein